MQKAVVVLIMCLLLTTIVSAKPILSMATDEDALQIQAEAMLEEVDAVKVAKNIEILPQPGRFLMWTRNLKHIMWGQYGNGYFKGIDNQGREAFGVYQGGIFAGFQDGKLFYGRYYSGRWTAYGLFGLRSASGSYVVFPPILRAEAMPLE